MGIKKLVGTKRIAKAGTSRVIFMEKEWNLEKDEYVDIIMRKADMSDDPIYTTKKICKIGAGLGFFVDKKHDTLRIGDMMVFSIHRKGKETEQYKPPSWMLKKFEKTPQGTIVVTQVEMDPRVIDQETYFAKKDVVDTETCKATDKPEFKTGVDRDEDSIIGDLIDDDLGIEDKEGDQDLFD